MALDDRAKQFLGTSPVTEVAGQTSTTAEQRLLEFRKKEFIERAGAFAEDLIAFFVDQKRKNDFLDDECVAAIALLAMNLRTAYGEPQNDDEQKKWTDMMRTARLAEFDAICEAMQVYYDENNI